MAIPESLLRDWESLTEEDQRMAQNYVRVLLQRRKPTAPADSRPSFPFGIWNGGLQFMAKDFNDTPEGFEDYTHDSATWWNHRHQRRKDMAL